MTDSLSRIHEEVSLKGQKQMFMASMNLSISQFCMAKVVIRYSLFSYHHLPLIAKRDSKSKQLRLMFRIAKIDSKSKQIYDSKNNIV